MTNEDQHRGNWTKIRETSSVTGDSSCSQWVERSAREVVVPHGSEGRATRSKNLTEKGLAYKKRLSERGEERLAKAQARIQAYNNIEFENGNEREQLQPKLLKENWMSSIRIDDASRLAKTKIKQDRGSVITKGQNAQYRNDWDFQDKMDRVNLPNKTAKDELVYGRDQKNITGMMCELLRQQAAPELDINMFDGNPMDFNYFMAVFKEVVENKVTDPRGRLTCLIKFIKGKAKEIGKNCIQLPSEGGFKTVKRLLTERFGNPHIITPSYHEEIKQWHQVKAGDADAYRRFQNLLVKCENIEHLQSWNVLHTPDIICMLLSKLPRSVRDKWTRKVLTTRRMGNREPEVADFIQFVDDETLIVTDPVFSKEAAEHYVEKKPSYKKGKILAFATRNEDNPDISIYYNERHKLESCKSFMEKTLKERIRFLAKQKSCYGCLKPILKATAPKHVLSN